VTALTPDIRALLVRGPGRSRRPVDLGATAAFAAGALLLVWSASIHFHLWLEPGGYRSIPAIGPLFLLQPIAGLVIGIAVVAMRRLWVAAAGAGFALVTVGGLLVTVAHGLFGFKDSWQAPFAVEMVAAAVLALSAALCLNRSVPGVRSGSTPVGATT
jgi:hypothetical protein